MIVDTAAGDIVYTNLFTGVLGNYLKGSIVAAGLDPGEPAGKRSEHDELRRRLVEGESLEGHLGRGPRRRRRA